MVLHVTSTRHSITIASVISNCSVLFFISFTMPHHNLLLLPVGMAGLQKTESEDLDPHAPPSTPASDAIGTRISCSSDFEESSVSRLASLQVLWNDAFA